MSNWKVTGPPRFFEGVGMVYPVTKGGSRFNAAEEDELKALLAGWISVEERLPENRQEVLAYRKGKRKELGPFFVQRCGNPHRPWRYLDGDRCDVTPTHWMPLPPLPQK